MMKRQLLFFSILLMAVIYGSFLAVDSATGFSSNLYSNSVRYPCILICLLLVFTAGKDAHSRKDLTLMKWAFFLTACADFMMSMICHYSFLSFNGCSWLDDYKFGIGVLFFMAVQLVYIRRHYQGYKFNGKELVTAVSVFGVMLLYTWWDLQHIVKSPAGSSLLITAVLVVYGIILCTGTWMAIGTIWRGHFPRVTAWFIAIGFILFFLCDNSLGRFMVFPQTVPIQSRSGFVLFEHTLAHARIQEDPTHDTISVYTDSDQMVRTAVPFTLKVISGVLIWFFYLPSQILLMLSTFKLDFLHSVFGFIKPARKKYPVEKR